MDPIHFIRTAYKLAKGRGGKPQQVDLRRAESAAYYAMFHCVCLAYANLLIGTSNTRSEGAWLQAYRSLNHGQLAQCCNRKDIMEEFSSGIQEFCGTLNILQQRRINADYNPNITLITVPKHSRILYWQRYRLLISIIQNSPSAKHLSLMPHPSLGNLINDFRNIFVMDMSIIFMDWEILKNIDKIT